jgi:hypothetical protein
MLDQGVIEPAQSPWASNLVLVKKKDGTLRCCVDYRQLNSVTRKDAYPLPRTDMCLDAMSGAKWFTTLDLRSSYHQVQLDPRDADKTAFICREGSFRFLTMPFGLCNAGATFQRLMDVIMMGLNFEVCLVYLDDIVVFSADLDQHLVRLRQVLERLKNAGLKLKPSKCEVMRRSVEFLGHIVSEAGIGPHPKKISDVLDWPVPVCLRELRAFLGLCGYYRRFVKGFSHIAAPLYALTEKGRTFTWSEACQVAFDELKQHLTTAPILAMPIDNAPFVLDTDASDLAIGAVLSEVIDGEERVIAYANRRLTRSEANYCVTRRELLAVVYFMKYFRHYLLGRRFTVRTDHAALQWLRRIPEPIGQQARWIGILEEFEYTIVHRAGSKHGNADAMSRRPCDRQRCCPKRTIHDESADMCQAIDSRTETPPDVQTEQPSDEPWLANAIPAEQKSDSDIGPIYRLLESQCQQPAWDAIAHLSGTSKTLWRQWSRLELVNNVLYRRFEPDDGSSTFRQVIMPRCRVQTFITLIHDGTVGGHFGIKRTKAAVRSRAYWPGWTCDVTAVLRRCALCAQYHRGTAPRQTPLKPFPAGEPWESISIDITGPHPRSISGNEYILTVQDNFTKWAEAYHSAIIRRLQLPKRCSIMFCAEWECRYVCSATQMQNSKGNYFKSCVVIWVSPTSAARHIILLQMA